MQKNEIAIVYIKDLKENSQYTAISSFISIITEGCIIRVSLERQTRVSKFLPDKLLTDSAHIPTRSDSLKAHNQVLQYTLNASSSS